jgi:transposase InsO family protein
MAHNRAFRDAPDPHHADPARNPAADDTQARRYRGDYRHHLWFIDIRYLVKLEGKWVYSLCLIEGYSRKILAGLVSPYQDLVAVLQALHAAIATYGCPAGIVSDNGAVFRSQGYQAVLATLGITAHYIDKGRPWQNLIEAQFGIQRRLADAQFAQANDLAACQQAHAHFIEQLNTTAHWAHRNRADGRRTPEAVLDWVRGRQVSLDEQAQAFRQFQVTRRVNAHGFVSIQRFFVYAERGLARQRVSVWVYEGRLRVQYAETVLAQYDTTYDRRTRRLSHISQPHLIETVYALPQLELFELDDTQWLKVYRRPAPRRPSRKPTAPPVEQMTFFNEVPAEQDKAPAEPMDTAGV